MTEVWGLDAAGTTIEPRHPLSSGTPGADGAQRLELATSGLGARPSINGASRRLTALLVAVIAVVLPRARFADAVARGRRASAVAVSSPGLEPVCGVTVAAAAVGGLLFVATGWVVAGIGGAIGGVAAGACAGDRRTTRHRLEQARIEALAGWCEQLRDLLSADHGIVGTIDATSRTCPEPIRPEVDRLASPPSRRQHRQAIGRFADEMDDPSADLVASVILLAMSRSSRTAEMLTELAATIRERASMRLRVEAERAGQRSEARFVIGFSGDRHRRRVDVRPRFRVPRRLRRRFRPGDARRDRAVFVFGGWWLARLTRFERPHGSSRSSDEPS